MPVDSDDIQAALVLDGVQKCLDNAENIFSDAVMLKDQNRHIRAFTLFHIAAEEAAKGLQLLFGYLTGDFDTAKQLSSYLGRRGAGKSHLNKIKRSNSVLFSLLYLTRTTDEYAQGIIEYGIAEVKKADQIVKDKERSLYVEFDGTGFTIPDASISLERCDEMLQRSGTTIHITKKFLQSLSAGASKIRKQMRDADSDSMKEKLMAELAASLNARPPSPGSGIR